MSDIQVSRDYQLPWLKSTSNDHAFSIQWPLSFDPSPMPTTFRHLISSIIDPLRLIQMGRKRSFATKTWVKSDVKVSSKCLVTSERAKHSSMRQKKQKISNRQCLAVYDVSRVSLMVAIWFVSSVTFWPTNLKESDEVKLWECSKFKHQELIDL